MLFWVIFLLPFLSVSVELRILDRNQNSKAEIEFEGMLIYVTNSIKLKVQI